MKLKLKRLDNFCVRVQAVNDRRSMVTVCELTKDGELTGKTWAEPYDNLLKDQRQLERRFDGQIGKYSPERIEPTYEKFAVSCTDGVEQIVHPILSIMANNMLNEMRERVERIANDEIAESAQVILERNMNYLTSRLHRKLTPLIDVMIKTQPPNGHSQWWQIWKRW